MEFDSDEEEENAKTKPKKPVDKPTKVTDGPKLKRTVTWPQREGKEIVSSLKVSRQHKPVSMKDKYICRMLIVHSVYSWPNLKFQIGLT